MPEIDQAADSHGNPEVRSEKSDVYARGLFWFAGIAVAAGVAILVGVAFLVGAMNTAQSRQMSSMPPLIARERDEEARDLVPTRDPEKRRQRTEEESGRRDIQPRLQADPAEDLKIMRAWEESELAKGRIPITRAMHMLADPANARKLGVASSKSAPARNTLSGTANSGRPIERRER
jgi:hypothetical protein